MENHGKSAIRNRQTPITTTKGKAPAKIVSILTFGSPSVALTVKTEMPNGGGQHPISTAMIVTIAEVDEVEPHGRGDRHADRLMMSRIDVESRIMPISRSPRRTRREAVGAEAAARHEVADGVRHARHGQHAGIEARGDEQEQDRGGDEARLLQDPQNWAK